jgi:hypothetical protein
MGISEIGPCRKRPKHHHQPWVWSPSLILRPQKKKKIKKNTKFRPKKLTKFGGRKKNL